MKAVLTATEFAARKHSSQRRKNADKTPYINHPIEVAHHLCSVGGVTDEDVIIAALLHDTIEDTETTQEEIAELFGDRVLAMVMECTDDKALPKQERKRLQIEHAPHKSPEAKMIKISDKTCNLRSILNDPPHDWSDERKFEYFTWAEQVVSGLLGVNELLDGVVTELIQKGLNEFKS